MIIPKKLLTFWLILFIPVFIVLLYGTYKQQEKNVTVIKQRANLVKHIGSKLPMLPLKDTSNKRVSLSHSFRRITIIDFWFAGCGPCIAEMKQFSKLFHEYPNKFEIISISVDPLSEWKRVLTGKSSENLGFLSSHKDTLWTHLNLDTASAVNFLSSSLNLTQYPSYLVVDSNGFVIEAPQSAVDYIEKVIGKEKGLAFFLTKTFSTEDGWINLAFSYLFYSGLFWTVTILFSWLRSFVKKRNSR